MPNFTGVTPIARLRCGWASLNSAISARRRSSSPDSCTPSQTARIRSGWRTGCPYGVDWPSL